MTYKRWRNDRTATKHINETCIHTLAWSPAFLCSFISFMLWPWHLPAFPQMVSASSSQANVSASWSLVIDSTAFVRPPTAPLSRPSVPSTRSPLSSYSASRSSSRLSIWRSWIFRRPARRIRDKDKLLVVVVVVVCRCCCWREKIIGRGI